MAITTKPVSSVLGVDVFTNKGMHIGRVADFKVDMAKSRIQSIIMDVAKTSFLGAMIGEKRGVIIPFSQVEAVGDVIIVKHITDGAIPATEEIKDEAPTSMF